MYLEAHAGGEFALRVRVHVGQHALHDGQPARTHHVFKKMNK